MNTPHLKRFAQTARRKPIQQMVTRIIFMPVVSEKMEGCQGNYSLIKFF
jgi:hypothetical protein